jgi:hypothetical protein
VGKSYFDKGLCSYFVSKRQMTGGMRVRVRERENSVLCRLVMWTLGLGGLGLTLLDAAAY